MKGNFCHPSITISLKTQEHTHTHTPLPFHSLTHFQLLLWPRISCLPLRHSPLSLHVSFQTLSCDYGCQLFWLLPDVFSSSFRPSQQTACWRLYTVSPRYPKLSLYKALPQHASLMQRKLPQATRFFVWGLVCVDVCMPVCECVYSCVCLCEGQRLMLGVGKTFSALIFW